MAQSQTMGVGWGPSNPSYKESTTPGTPGAIVAPPTKPTDPEGFGWKALDYKFGDRPLYQVAKSLLKQKTSAGNGGFCGKQTSPQGGMANQASKAALARTLATDAAAPAAGVELPAAAEVDYSAFV